MRWSRLYEDHLRQQLQWTLMRIDSNPTTYNVAVDPQIRISIRALCEEALQDEGILKAKLETCAYRIVLSRGWQMGLISAPIMVTQLGQCECDLRAISRAVCRAGGIVAYRREHLTQLMLLGRLIAAGRARDRRQACIAHLLRLSCRAWQPRDWTRLLTLPYNLLIHVCTFWSPL